MRAFLLDLIYFFLHCVAYFHEIGFAFVWILCMLVRNYMQGTASCFPVEPSRGLHRDCVLRTLLSVRNPCLSNFSPNTKNAEEGF